MTIDNLQLKMKDNVIKIKSFEFAVQVVNLYKHISTQKNEFVLSKQLLRSGTSVGAMIREAEHSESTLDFIHKLAIAQKEINETIYWLELLHQTDYLDQDVFHKMNDEATSIIKLLTAIIKTTKRKLSKK